MRGMHHHERAAFWQGLSLNTKRNKGMCFLNVLIFHGAKLQIFHGANLLFNKWPGRLPGAAAMEDDGPPATVDPYMIMEEELQPPAKRPRGADHVQDMIWANM